MNSRFLTILSVLVLILVAGSNAQPDCGDMGCHGKHREFIKELGLTDDQQTKLQLLKLDAKKERVLHYAEVKKVRDKVKTELLKEKPSKSVLDGFSVEIGKLHGELSKKRMVHFLKVKEVLNKEQFKKLLSKEGMMKMMGKYHKKHCGKGKRH